MVSNQRRKWNISAALRESLQPQVSEGGRHSASVGRCRRSTVRTKMYRAVLTVTITNTMHHEIIKNFLEYY